MILLHVRLTRENGQSSPVGHLAFSEANSQGFFQSEFRYLNTWLEAPDAFPLDPIHLKLTPKAYPATQLYPPFGVFEDALPDDWGRDLLVRARQLAPRQRALPWLLRALGAQGMGALTFEDEDTAGTRAVTTARIDLPVLLAAAQAFDAGEAVAPESLLRLYAAGSSPGGARPKALVHDARGEWLAKFPSRRRDGPFDVVGLEAACMRLAGSAGLEVPETDLISVSRRKILLVKRFDVVGDTGRRHMISFRSLLGERPGVVALGYAELAAMVRRVSAHPAEDVSRLFRQMVFNAAIGNTDDHLKNFWMLHCEDGYRLSPAFDLVPDIGGNRHHLLQFQYDAAPPDRDTVLAVARSWGIKDGADIVDRVVAAVARFRRVAAALQVSRHSIDTFGADMDHRRARLRARTVGS